MRGPQPRSVTAEPDEVARRMAWAWMPAALFVLVFIGVMAILIAVPGIDLAVSRAFYSPDTGFTHAPVLAAVHAGLRYAVIGIIAAAGLALLWPGRRRAALFVLLALALGPGLIVNTVFKDHWGRARPAEIAAFGGSKMLTRPFVPADQCRRNCSFPAGDPAVGFFLIAPALLIRRRAYRRAACTGAILTGTALGLMRIAQGGHFFSDVVACGFLVTAISLALHRAVIGWDGLGALARTLRPPSAPMLALAAGTAGAGVTVMMAYFELDRPLALFVREHLGAAQPLAAIVTTLGLGGPYLAAAALAATGLWIAGRIIWAWRAAYIFLAVATSGLLADIIKVIAGRPRPKLWFADQLFGFMSAGPRADFWSFPSGHSVTAGALAVALSVVMPRLTPLWVLVAFMIGASRILLDAHYLSDVVAGFYLGVVTAWALAAALGASGLRLSSEPAGAAISSSVFEPKRTA